MKKFLTIYLLLLCGFIVAGCSQEKLITSTNTDEICKKILPDALSYIGEQNRMGLSWELKDFFYSSQKQSCLAFMMGEDDIEKYYVIRDRLTNEPIVVYDLENLTEIQQQANTLKNEGIQNNDEIIEKKVQCYNTYKTADINNYAKGLNSFNFVKFFYSKYLDTCVLEYFYKNQFRNYEDSVKQFYGTDSVLYDWNNQKIIYQTDRSTDNDEYFQKITE